MPQNEGLEAKLQDTLAAILKATKEQTAGVGKFATSLQEKILEQNAAILAAVQEQTRAIERQTQAIEKLAAPERPKRECRKRNRVEGTSADDDDDDNWQETGAIKKLLSLSQKRAPAARKKKKKAPAPAKDVLFVTDDAETPLAATCTWTIPNFSSLELGIWGEKTSEVFSIGGHKWKLYVYPRGRDAARDKFISLYLEIADDTDKMPQGWQVTVASTFSVICQHSPEESHNEEGDEPDIFDAVDKSWGWNELIPLKDFYDAENGFLVNDTMIIEARMEVKAPEPAPSPEPAPLPEPAPPKADVQNKNAPPPPPSPAAAAAQEKADVQNSETPSAQASAQAPAKEVVAAAAAPTPLEGTHTWRIPNFSSLKVDCFGQKFSNVFSIGGHKWKLRICPRGADSEKDKSVSLYLVLADDTEDLPNDWKVTVDFSLSLVCQCDSFAPAGPKSPTNSEKSHKKEIVNGEFSAKCYLLGCDDFISLTDFHDVANGFLVNDTVVIEAKIEVKAPAGIVSVNATSPLEGTCTWTIPHFSKLELGWFGEKYSDVFSVGGHKWKFHLYPRGDKHEKDRSVSFYLVLADDTNKLPDNCKVIVDLSLSVICQHDRGKSHKSKDCKNTEFDVFGAVRGRHSLISLTDFHDAANGFLVNDTVTFEARIEVKKPDN